MKFTSLPHRTQGKLLPSHGSAGRAEVHREVRRRFGDRRAIDGRAAVRTDAGASGGNNSSTVGMWNRSRGASLCGSADVLDDDPGWC